ncbi:unnamed protein product [Scytosiphon promiscuus]
MAPLPGSSTWLPHAYSLVCMIVAPLGILLVLPISYVDMVYVVSSISYVFVCVWTFIQTIAAWYLDSRKSCSASVRGRLRSSFGPSIRYANLVYIVPAYLNNEADILDDTISSYCNLTFNGRIHVMLVYNCKGDMSEAELALKTKWDGMVAGRKNNISVSIVKNLVSTSKAENVNYALTLVPSDVDYIAIMDADHQPSSNSASVATRLLQTEGYDVLQGACTIRNQDNFLCRMISVEFEHMYCVAHPGRFLVFDLGLFVGSNGYWKSSVLKKIQMEKSMLTEDVDSSIRASLAGYKIGSSADVLSSELAPLNYTVLQKQRLRWAQGWAEVSMKHAQNCFSSCNLSMRQKLGVIYLLVLREIFPYTAFWPLSCLVAKMLRQGFFIFNSVWAAIGAAVLLLGLARVTAAYALSRGPIGSSIGAFVLFSIWGLFFDVYLNHLQVVGHGRSILKANAWVATVRQ